MVGGSERGFREGGERGRRGSRGRMECGWSTSFERPSRWLESRIRCKNNNQQSHRLTEDIGSARIKGN